MTGCVPLCDTYGKKGGGGAPLDFEGGREHERISRLRAFLSMRERDREIVRDGQRERESEIDSGDTNKLYLQISSRSRLLSDGNN